MTKQEEYLYNEIVDRTQEIIQLKDEVRDLQHKASNLQDDANFWEMKCREIWSKAGGMNPMNKDYKNFFPGEQFSWEGDQTSSPCVVEIVEVFDADTIKVATLDTKGIRMLLERYVHPSELKPL